LSGRPHGETGTFEQGFSSNAGPHHKPLARLFLLTEEYVAQARRQAAPLSWAGWYILPDLVTSFTETDDWSD
ncbi:hypothetical protein AMTR_s00274p00013110, partial [Amborella trichopoda]